MAFNSTFIAALDHLLAANGMTRSINGDKITILDPVRGAQSLQWNGRQFGLEAADLGAVFTSQGRRYRLTGVKPNRPKYPLEAECVSTGRQFKFPINVVPLIVALRGVCAPAAPAQAPVQAAAPTAPTHNPYAGAGIF